MKKRIFGQLGFSLIELLVVIFITTVLSTLIVINYRSGQQRYNLDQTTQRLAANLRRMQNAALAPKIESGQTLPSCGYGIYTSSNSQYQLFYNVAANCNSVNKYYTSGSSVVLETVNLSGVTLTYSGPSCASDRCMSTYFIPPDPTTYIANNDSGPRVFTLTAGTNRTITVYLSGRIDIQ